MTKPISEAIYISRFGENFTFLRTANNDKRVEKGNDSSTEPRF